MKSTEMIQLARIQLAGNLFNDTIETCRSVLRVEKNYMAHVFAGASNVALGNCTIALNHLKFAIQMEPANILAIEAMGNLFQKCYRNMEKETSLMRDIYLKMMEFCKDDSHKRQQVTEQYLRIFKGLKDPRGIYLTTASLLTDPHFPKQSEKLKHFTSFEFVNSIQDGNISFENDVVNKKIETTTLYLMKSDLSDVLTVEMAWKVYFNLKNKPLQCQTINNLWSLATLHCPRPKCRFNAERILLMFMETYPVHEVKEVLEYEEALPKDNAVCRLFNAFWLPDVPEAILEILEVLSSNVYLVIAYVRLSMYHYKHKDYEKSFSVAEQGLRIMKHSNAIYHLSYPDMVNLFQISIFRTRKKLNLGTLNLSKLIVYDYDLTSHFSDTNIYIYQAMGKHHSLKWEEANKEKNSNSFK